jgi:allantoicase
MDFTDLIDLASERLGSKVIAANDDFFAPKHNLLKPTKPIFIEGKYTSRGKWMDGWETRRRRTPGYDWCTIRLGQPGVVRGVVVDTAHFKGNYPESCSLEACVEKDEWVEILPKSPLKGDSQNPFPIANGQRFTHLRLNIFPDGGVARLRVHGEVKPSFERLSGRVDLAAIENGAYALLCSDMFFGNRHNLLMPGRAPNMSDGWETKRRRGPGHDWMIIRLAAPGTVERIEVDTNHYKGNCPASCTLEACTEYGDAAKWVEVLPNTPLHPHTRHYLEKQLQRVGRVTHVRFNIFPDGGVSRLRLWGRVAALDRLNVLTVVQAQAEFLTCCGSLAWAAAMAVARPFASEQAVYEKAEAVAQKLRPEDRLAAFAAHPKIGDRRARGQAAKEQSGAARASARTLKELAAANRDYQKRFGFIFIVCATGKSAAEMLGLLRQRLKNTPEKELAAAAGEQRKITRLRLERLLNS